MANQWFKFYGAEYLSDPKVLSLSGDERSCWITLLSLASQTKDGTIKFLPEERLLSLSAAKGYTPIYEKLSNLDMILVSNGDVTVKNWEKRQLSESVFRVREYRKRQNNDEVTTEENREEKNRKEKIYNSVSYLENIPDTDIEEFYGKYDVSRSKIKEKGQALFFWCNKKGRTYKNYRMALQDALLKDYGLRAKNAAPHIPKVDTPRASISAELKESMRNAARGIKPISK